MCNRVLYEINERAGGGWEIVRPLHSLAEEFRSFRTAQISARESPVVITPGPFLIVHFFPNGCLNATSSVDFDHVDENRKELRGLVTHAGSYRYNADGYLNSASTADAPAPGYVQLFRNGVIEAVSTELFTPPNGQRYIASRIFEDEIIEAVESYTRVVERFGASPPHLVLATLVDATGLRMAVDESGRFGFPVGPIDRSPLNAPPAVVDDGATVALALRPVFDYFWQAAGYARSEFYQADGTRSR